MWAALLWFAVGPCFGQSPAAPTAGVTKAVSFDVISVRPSDPGSQGVRIRLTPDGYMMQNIPVDFLLREGLQLSPDQVAGEPQWARSQGWNISAKVAAEDVPALGQMNFDERRRMFIKVLTERFGLKYHTEQRELPVYALVPGKGGPKLTASTHVPDESQPGKGAAGKLMMGPGRVSGEGTTMQFLADALSRQLGRAVKDKTGLAGRYDFTLTWTPEAGSGSGAGDRPGGPESAGGGPTLDPGSGASLFTAVQEQLGLKLEPQKAMVDVVVVDSVEKPAEN
jgi:uncharacterized protein (TIGR03435 family)